VAAGIRAIAFAVIRPRVRRSLRRQTTRQAPPVAVERSATNAIARPGACWVDPAESTGRDSCRNFVSDAATPPGRCRGGQNLPGPALMQVRAGLIGDLRTRLAALADRG
jgi:hypothetical protein